MLEIDLRNASVGRYLPSKIFNATRAFFSRPATRNLARLSGCKATCWNAKLVPQSQYTALQKPASKGYNYTSIR